MERIPQFGGRTQIKSLIDQPGGKICENLEHNEQASRWLLLWKTLLTEKDAGFLDLISLAEKC
jgi:hypothetical protein